MHDNFGARAMVPPSRLRCGKGDRRSEKRHVALLRVALLHTTGKRSLCVVKNISTHGLSARLYSDLERGAKVEIEFRSGERLQGSVVWKESLEIGIRFPRPIDVETVLASRWLVELSRRRNLPRIGLWCEGRIKKGTEHFAVELQDISQGGARLRVGRHLDIGRVVLTLSGLSPIAGVIRWVADGIAGVSFDECVAFDQLASWIEDKRRDQQLVGRPHAS